MPQGGPRVLQLGCGGGRLLWREVRDRHAQNGLQHRFGGVQAQQEKPDSHVPSDCGGRSGHRGRLRRGGGADEEAEKAEGKAVGARRVPVSCEEGTKKGANRIGRFQLEGLYFMCAK